MQAAVLTTIAIGAAMIVASLTVWNQTDDGAESGYPPAATEEYGRRLLRDTALYIGPNHDNPEMRYSGTTSKSAPSRARCHCCRAHPNIRGIRAATAASATFATVSTAACSAA
jgi:hypothetical protein